MEKIAKRIVKHRNKILLLAILLLIPSFLGFVNTRVNYDILTYLPQESESMVNQTILNDDFNLASTDLLVIHGMKDKDVVTLKEKIKTIEGVETVLWRDDLFDITIPQSALPKVIQDNLYAEDSTLMIVTFSNPAASDETMDAIAQIKKYANLGCLQAGFSAITEDTKDLVLKETPIYTSIAIVLCLLILCLGLESWVAPFVFLLGILFPIAYNMGTNFFLGEISYITKALALILQLAVTMDYSIFLLHRYQEEKRKDISNEEAMSQAIQATFTSITGSSITTIAGFLALCFMQLTLGKDIGLVMAKGVIFGVVCTIIVLPSLIMFFDPWIEKYTHPVLIRPLKRVPHWVQKQYKKILVVFVLLFVPAAIYQTKVSQYYDLTASLPEDLVSVQGTNALKEKFGMTTTHFVMVDDQVSQKEMQEIAHQFEAIPGIEQVISYESISGAGFPASFEPDAIADVFHNGNKRLMIVNSSYRAATDAMNEQLDDMDAILHVYDPQATIGGEGSMTRDLIHTTDTDFKMVNVISILAIFLIIAIAFRSFSLPFILVLSIEFAIAINMAIPYFTKTQLPFIAGIVIGTIQLGACIDYAILMTTRFKEELQNGYTAKEAAGKAIEKTSTSIITSGLSFFAACTGVGMVAQMDLLASLCNLLGRGALISIFVILFILPSMLIVFQKWICKTTKQWPIGGMERE